MIIDCHGHYTTAPKQHEQWRQRQIEAHSQGAQAPQRPEISDDEIRDSIRNGQLRVQGEATFLEQSTTFRFRPLGSWYTGATQRWGYTQQGQVIGAVGSTGDASAEGPHLHYEIKVMAPGEPWWQGRGIDPYPLLAGQ